MGMSASQARYLALTARKTNTEYEGQQINQARTALANQSANLFNRLLALEVPTAPKTTDYTEIQYSYSDGDSDSVLNNWQQLSTADPNYNYIVDHYYYADIYTGGEKLLENPQVTSKGTLLSGSWQTVANNDHPTNPVVMVNYNADGSATIEINGQQYSTYLPVSMLNSTNDNDLKNALKDLIDNNIIQENSGIADINGLFASQDVDGVWHFMLQSDINAGNPTDYYSQYDPAYIGNCKLTELITTGATDRDKADNLDKDVKAALEQIIKDCPDSNLSKYLKFTPQNGLEYTGGGIYTFELNGKTYYTDRYDLDMSMQTQDEYGKPIENQQKLPYYNASYINKKIEKTDKALIETDENGRFKSVKFENDSVVYSLNTETVTNEEAYQDAMNEYNYKVQQYEKTIADINAKTSIIQKEDRTLELRLKQLDTEQNALKTEMESVKKVIKDSVDKIFKTFSD